MRARAVLGTVVMVLALAGCRPDQSPAPGASAAIPVGRSDHSLSVAGLGRTYHLYRPASLPAAAPLVVMLHGGFGTGAQAEEAYGWDAQADTGRFLVAYPDGLNRAWAVGGGCCGTPGSTGVDDTAFITALVREVSAALPVDPSRVFATGISNGGMMAYRLACDTTVFAAIGPDSATLLGPCPAPAPVSVLHIHGTADHNIPYQGGQGSGYAHINGPAVPDVVASWRRVDDCQPESRTTVGVVTTSVAICPSGRSVELVSVAGAGHQWPGAPDKPVLERVLGLDPPSKALNATATIWGFFAAHPKPPA